MSDCQEILLVREASSYQQIYQIALIRQQFFLRVKIQKPVLAQKIHLIQLLQDLSIIFQFMDPSGTERTQSEISEFQAANPDPREVFEKAKRQLRFLKIVVLILFLTVLAFIFKLVDVQGSLNAVSQKVSASINDQFDQRQIRSALDLQAMKAKIAELEATLNASSKQVTQMKDQIATKAESSEAAFNFTELSEYVTQGFSKVQTTINFLHMHESEIFYYQKLEYLRRYADTGFIKSNSKAKIAYMQLFNNYKFPHTNAPLRKEIDEWIKKDYERVSKEYDFSLPELPFCLVVPTLDNAKDFRYEYNLQSMVNLDYKNFRIVIVDDASTDHTYELIKQWIEDNKITNDIVVLANKERMTALPNIHKAVTQHCAADSIVVLVDGDDELIGRYILKIFNHVYHKKKAGIVYSQHIQHHTRDKQMISGFSSNYSDEQKRSNRYRDIYMKASHLRTFKTSLYLKIKEEDLKDDKGNWLTSTYDEVICLPILQMSCGRNLYIQEYFYFYNYQMGSNDDSVNKSLQVDVSKYIKTKKPKYKCVNE